MSEAQRFNVLRAQEAERIEKEWGSLTWYASRSLGNSTEMTTGICRLKPGMANPRHSHPNCSEVLTVLEGRIMHTSDAAGNEVELGPGDTITASPHRLHQARNVGDTEAVLIIAFSSADREVQGE